MALTGADQQLDQQLAQHKAAEVRASIGLISQTANQLNGLLDNLLAWALDQSGAIEIKKSSLELEEFAGENLSRYRGAANTHGITLRNSIAPDTTVFADGNALYTILRNFIASAVKYSRHGSTVEITHHREGKEDIITVRDNGAGIAKELQHQLFTLHRGGQGGGLEKSGTGLGLILCKELHGGRVEV